MLQSNRELPSRKIITPLRDIGLSARDFTGFSTAVPSPHRYHEIAVHFHPWLVLFHAVLTENVYLTAAPFLGEQICLCRFHHAQALCGSLSNLTGAACFLHLIQCFHLALATTHWVTPKIRQDEVLLQRFQILGWMLVSWNSKVHMVPLKGFKGEFWERKSRMISKTR